MNNQRHTALSLSTLIITYLCASLRCLGALLLPSLPLSMSISEQLALSLGQEFFASVQASSYLTAAHAQTAADVAAAGGDGKAEPPATELWCR